MKKQKIIAVALGVSVTLSAAGASPAWAKSSDEIQHHIDQVHNKQDAKKQALKEDKSKLDQIGEKRREALQELEQLKEQISKTEDSINKKQVEINDTRDKIDKLKKEIEATKKRIKRRNKILKKRVRYMYENGSTVDYLQVLLGSQSFSNFLDRVVALHLIAKQDKQLLEAQKADKKRLEDDKKTVQQQLDKLQDQLGSLENMRDQLSEKKQQKSELAAKLKKQAASIKQDIHDEHQAMTYIESKIQGLIKKREAARKREEEARRRAEARKRAAARKKAAAEAARKKAAQAKQNQSNSDSGSSVNVSAHVQTSSGTGLLINPVPGGYVTSGYGWRTLRGGSDFHDGIDYGAPCGTAIVAAGSGTVLYAGPASGFGNWIVIDLNNGMYTVYGHMYDNEIYVHSGEHVSQGQQIGAVGSNGDSTGCHLHFELDHSNLSGDNGINPNPYF